MFNKVSVKVALKVNLALLIVIVIGTYYIISQQSASLEKQLLERGRIESLIGAMQISEVMEEAIDNGVFTVTDAFDMDYQEIPGSLLNWQMVESIRKSNRRVRMRLVNLQTCCNACV